MVVSREGIDLRSGLESARVLSMVVDLRRLDERPLDALRVLLVADVAGRVVEQLLGGEARLVVVESDTAAALERRHAAEALWISEPIARVQDPSGAARAVGAATHLAFYPDDWDVSQVWSAARARRIGAVWGHRMDAAHLLELAGADQLVLRLALLRFHYLDSAELSVARVHRAEETLLRWRFKMAGWAERPPARPVDTQAVIARLIDDLDTGLALRFLHRVETDPQLASGTKFATFVALDRVLALDLAHQVGRLRH